MNTLTILTGAGISTSAGIPDFRGKEGLWITHPELQNIFDYREFMSKPKVRKTAWSWMKDDASMEDREPTTAHMAITNLVGHGLTALATQNIDLLHEAAGSNGVEHLHGSVSSSHCQRCHAEYATEDVIRHLDDEPDPHCHRWNDKKHKECGGVIKMDVVYFGESLDKHMMQRVHDAMFWSDEFWAVGTSLKVFPVADLMSEAIALGKHTVIVNGSRTDYDSKVSEVIHGDIQETLPELVSRRLTI
jgi:NAD-dependent deacetylase